MNKPVRMTFILVFLGLAFWQWNCDSLTLSHKYYAKRKYCNSKYQYEKAIENPDENSLKNYFKLSFKSDKLWLEAAYKDKDHPVGLWLYYNDEGKLSKEELYKKDSRLKDEKIYEYDDQSRLTKETSYIFENDKKKLSVETHLFYSDKGLLYKKENFNAGYLDEYITYQYDQQDKLSRENFFQYNELNHYVMYSYDSLGLLTKKENYDKNNVLNSIESLEYDKSNNLTKIELVDVDSNGDKELNSLTLHYYNEKSKKIKTDNFGSDSVKREERRYYYSEDGCLKKEEIYDGAGELLDVR